MMSPAFPDMDFTRGLQRLLEAGRQEAARRGHSVLVSLTVALSPVEPHLLFNRAQDQERILWEQPSQAFSLVAFGATVRFTGHSEERFSQIAAGWRSLLSSTLSDSPPSCPFPAPISLGGFAFDPARRGAPGWEEYPDALLVIPRYLFISCRGSSWLSVNMLVAPGCNQQDSVDAVVCALQELLRGGEAALREEQAQSIEVQQHDAQVARWQETIVSVVNEITRGAVEKLVLARQVSAYSPQPLDPGALIARLRVGYGHCTVFAFASNQSCFVGATPERMVRLDGRRVQTDCLAGSTSRGDTDAKDRTLGEALLADHKERREHDLVVRTLHDVLAPLCVRLSAPETPTLLRLPNVQHLYTPLEGALKEESDIFALVAALHPTPATGGLPRDTACTLLRTYEDFDRGWYAGPVGWVDGHGGGEFVVAIRSALLRGHEARLFAGCGIVAGSDPEREYAESCFKLRPMLWAMNDGQT